MHEHDPKRRPFQPAPATPKVVKPGSPAVRRPAPTEADAPPFAAERLTALAHDLSGMIDGSMRWLAIAERTLPEEPGASAERLERARGQIELVRDTLARMALMVGAAMKSASVPLGSPLLGVGEGVSLAEAIDHAAEVLRPLAAEHGVEIALSIAPEAGVRPAGSLYSVVLNGVRNAVESIADLPAGAASAGGRIEVIARRVEEDRAAWLEVVVEDDGPGLARGLTGEGALDYGTSTRGAGRGMGLAISAALVRGVRGDLRLEGRGGAAPRSGARLVARVPDEDPGSITIG
jgi:signal transduction histidine kinase